MSSGRWSQHGKKKKKVLLLVFRPFIVWKTAWVPSFISKDSHYSIFSPGPHRSLSGGAQNLMPERRLQGWSMVPPQTGTKMNSTQILHPPFPRSNSVKHYKIFLKRRIYHLFSELTECLRFYFACSAYLDWVTDFILPKEVFEQSQVLIMHRSNHAGDPGTVHLLSLNRHHQ